MKHFERTYLRPFTGLNVLYLVNIQPNLKAHPPHQNFLDPLLPRAPHPQVKGAKISLKNVFLRIDSKMLE